MKAVFQTLDGVVEYEGTLSFLLNVLLRPRLLDLLQFLSRECGPLLHVFVKLLGEVTVGIKQLDFLADRHFGNRSEESLLDGGVLTVSFIIGLSKQFRKGWDEVHGSRTSLFDDVSEGEASASKVGDRFGTLLLLELGEA